MNPVIKRQYPLQLHISTLFVVLIFLIGGLLAVVGYKLTSDLLQKSADRLIAMTGSELVKDMQSLVAPAEISVALIGQTALPGATTFAQRMQRLPLLKEALDSSPVVTSVYVGYPNGDFFFLRRLWNDADRTFFKTPEGTSYILQAIEHTETQHKGRFVFLSPVLDEIKTEDKPEYATSYDPRTRLWFKRAIVSSTQIKTEPYVFSTTGKLGTTVAGMAAGGGSVVGADILLESLSVSLTSRKATPNTEIAVVNEAGKILAHEDVKNLSKMSVGPDPKLEISTLENFGRPILAAIAPLLKEMKDGGSIDKSVEIAGVDWRISLQPLRLEGAKPLFLLVAIPEPELLATAIKARNDSLLLTLLMIVLAVPVTMVMARGISGPIGKLIKAADAIRNFDFSSRNAEPSLIKEVNQLGSSMDGMKGTIRRFLDISTAVSGEQNFDRLLPMLLRETLGAADAEFGILFLSDRDGLIPIAVLNDKGEDVEVVLMPVALDDTGPLIGAALAEGIPKSRAMGPDDVAALGLDDLGDFGGDPYGVAVPLLNRDKVLVGAMLLLRRTPIEDAQVSFIERLAVTAASTLETRELIKAQKELFEAFIALIAGAIDSKSPYTGGHCARVPELTKMLARAACAETSGPYADFQLSEGDWEAVHVGAWLHDCGKVTTPEYVVDKATKLETIYDRIHEVRMRFEVLKRDAEIASLQAVAKGANPEQAKEKLATVVAELDADYVFIATCNEGGEFMAPEKVERLRVVAERTWLRTLDDRIGISHEEKLRKERTDASPLPVREPLLSDKPEHLFERRPQDRMPENNQWGFRMKVPALLYNKGELYNLSVGRGTLSEEERFKINEHIVQTLIMLTALPFPKHLREVPEIAAGHHEKMDGTGYPRCLKKDQMSPVARMMAIADVFEALTAVDRPYKKGKTLSEAIKIMSFMKKDQHLDSDLFDLFLSSGAYREYAERFMKPEQIDEVDIAKYLAAVAV